MAQLDHIDGLPNRVLDAIALHVQQEAVFGVDNPGYRNNDPEALELKRRHLEGIIQGFRKDPDLNWREKYGLNYARHELRKTKLQQRPTFLRILLYAKPLRWLVNIVRRRNRYYNDINRIMNNYGKKTAIDINAANLQQTLKEYGFNNQLEGPMVTRMAYGPPEFSIRTPEVSKADTNYILHFKKNPGSNTYYFAGFDANKRAVGPAAYTAQNVSAPLSFRTSDKIQFNAAEAQSLTHGNLVLKIIDGQDTWVGTTEDGPRLQTFQFNLEKELDILPIKEMEVLLSRESLLKELTAGKEQFITLHLPNGEEKGLIVNIAKDTSGNRIQLKFRDEHGRVNAYDLAKDRSNAQQILQNIKKAPLMRNTSNLRLV